MFKPKKLIPILCLMALSVFPPASSFAGLDSRMKPLAGFAGYTGIWDMPSARILPDWHTRLGASFSFPYYYFQGSIGFFDRLEVTGRFTGARGVPALSPGYEDSRDKAVDFKLLLLKEGQLWPAVSIGATDIFGTGLYTSRYLAATFSGLSKIALWYFSTALSYSFRER